MKYHVEIRHLTAMQRRLAVGSVDRPFVVVDSDTNTVIDRYRTRTGAQARADRMNRNGS